MKWIFFINCINFDRSNFQIQNVSACSYNLNDNYYFSEILSDTEQWLLTLKVQLCGHTCTVFIEFHKILYMVYSSVEIIWSSVRHRSDRIQVFVGPSKIVLDQTLFPNIYSLYLISTSFFAKMELMTGYFYAPGIKDSGAYSFWPVRLFVCLSVCLFVRGKNFNIGHNFWMISDRAFIFHMCIPCDKTFHMVP